MHNFKVGDEIERISDFTGGLSVGTRVVVTGLMSSGHVKVEGYSGHYSEKNFILVAPKPTPRPHAEIATQWFADDSLEVECKLNTVYNKWFVTYAPTWDPNTEYRIKTPEPTEKELALKTLEEAQDFLAEAKRRFEEL